MVGLSMRPGWTGWSVRAWPNSCRSHDFTSWVWQGLPLTSPEGGEVCAAFHLPADGIAGAAVANRGGERTGVDGVPRATLPKEWGYPPEMQTEVAQVMMLNRVSLQAPGI